MEGDPPLEKLPLLPIEPPHHGPPPPPIRTTATESLFAVTFNEVLQHYLPTSDIGQRGKNSFHANALMRSHWLRCERSR
jgi:hypothetical protein